MARLEHIKRRLDNWALWRSRRDDGGLGYARSSILVSDSTSRACRDGSWIPVVEHEAVETDEAVTALKLGKDHDDAVVTAKAGKEDAAEAAAE